MTSCLTEEQINLISKRVLDLLDHQRSNKETIFNRKKDLSNIHPLKPGIFPDVNTAVTSANYAYRELMKLTLETRKKIIANIRKKMLENNDILAEKACSETGLGKVEDKILKNSLVIKKTPGTEYIEPRVFSGDNGLTLVEHAPYGIIGAITPITNPTSTIICNTIGMIAAGNSVVFNVHPGAKQVSIDNIVLLNQAITEVGGPVNLVTAVANPTIESAQELMHNPAVRLLVVTGGASVVKEAMISGKRAICAGPGNPPVVVDESADIEQAAKDIILGASMDNNIICVDEKEVFVVESIANSLNIALQNHGAIQLTKQQFGQLEPVIFSEMKSQRRSAVMNKSMIGKDIQTILSQIGIQVDSSTRLAVIEVDKDHPLVWTEQMIPILPIVRVNNADEGIDLAKEVEQGYGHSAIMHSKNLDNLSRMAREMNCSIFVKNGPAVAGLGYKGEGYSSFSIASPTGEGLTNARSFSRERRCVLVDHFRII
jgi:acyl-CoA reductase-like NAD-dependent aldehyde dehydrogenase